MPDILCDIRKTCLQATPYVEIQFKRRSVSQQVQHQQVKTNLECAAPDRQGSTYLTEVSNESLVTPKPQFGSLESQIAKLVKPAAVELARSQETCEPSFFINRNEAVARRPATAHGSPRNNAAAIVGASDEQATEAEHC